MIKNSLKQDLISLDVTCLTKVCDFVDFFKQFNIQAYFEKNTGYNQIYIISSYSKLPRRDINYVYFRIDEKTNLKQLCGFFKNQTGFPLHLKSSAGYRLEGFKTLNEAINFVKNVFDSKSIGQSKVQKDIDLVNKILNSGNVSFYDLDWIYRILSHAAKNAMKDYEKKEILDLLDKFSHTENALLQERCNNIFRILSPESN